MRILALQLKRIGDLVLTAPALAALKAARPDAHITLAAHTGAAPLVSTVAAADAGIVFGPGRGWAPWQQVLTGLWDVVLDFTGTDRSALAAALSRAPERVAFDWVKKNRIRTLAYNRFVTSAVREFHTVDHYAHLAGAAVSARLPDAPAPTLRISPLAQQAAEQLLSDARISGPFAIVHPGTARAEKYWQASRWAEVIAHVRETFGLSCVITGGSDPFERAHLAEIEAAAGAHAAGAVANLAGRADLPTFAALVEKARIVLSCDTAIVHLAAAFQKPQIALFGPTNPFHWRPRHAAAAVLSAAQPEAPLTEFTPRMKGAPTDRISTAAVIRATDALLAPMRT